VTSGTVDLLAVAAHPDDAEVGCGGALILAGASGLRVAVVDLTRGERSTSGTVEQREKERAHAAELLGLSRRVGLDLPDAAVGSDPSHRDALVGVLRELRPRIVLAPNTDDRHPDHAAAGHLAREAVFIAGVGRVAGGVPHRPRRLYHYSLHHPFEPTFVLDVSAVWGRRMQAVRAYASQFGQPPGRQRTEIGGSGFLELLEARGAHYGAMIGAVRGEPYRCCGPLRATMLPELDEAADATGAPSYRCYL
jgi:bacillithiol biosynthesis deacetylase BshB1